MAPRCFCVHLSSNAFHFLIWRQGWMRYVEWQQSTPSPLLRGINQWNGTWANRLVSLCCCVFSLTETPHNTASFHRECPEWPFLFFIYPFQRLHWTGRQKLAWVLSQFSHHLALWPWADDLCKLPSSILQIRAVRCPGAFPAESLRTPLLYSPA